MEFWAKHPRAKTPLERWHAVTGKVLWTHFQEVRQTFRHTDQITVASGKTVAIFNIAGNHYRMVVAIHYNAAKVFILRVMTHSEYDQKSWKEDL